MICDLCKDKYKIRKDIFGNITNNNIVLFCPHNILDTSIPMPENPLKLLSCK